MRKLFFSCVLLTALLTTTITSFAEKIAEDKAYTGVYIINNRYNNIDYKVLASDTDALAEELAGDTELEIMYTEGYQNLQNLSTAESWLISHDIISRRYQLSDDNCISTGIDLNQECFKSDLYLMLYKSYNGVIESRPLVLNQTSKRNDTYVTSMDNYKETDLSVVNAKFPNGDYFILYSANVYELYFKELLDKGIISTSEFNAEDGERFLNDYRMLCEYLPGDANISWDNRLPYARSSIENVLGYTHSYSDTDSIEVKENLPIYFKNENLVTIDALTIIADFIRLSEKDMSELEAKIVSYKYGINYLNGITDDQRADIEFLIAKGILDYENPEEFTNLYSEFTYEDAIKIMYKVANRDARLNFSEITLTDSDTFWMDNGYLENKFSINTVSALPYAETITEEDWQRLIANNQVIESIDNSNDTNINEPTNDTFIDDILESNLFNSTQVYADTSMDKFTVIKMFDISFDYRYKNIPLTELAANSDTCKEFVSYEEYKFKMINSDNVKTFAKVTFQVEAKDYDTAILFIDNNIVIDKSINSTDVIGYTTITSADEEITLISATTLRNSISGISIIEDKILMNNVTGTQAIIMPDAGYALVGNRVIRSDALLMTDTSDEVYYNLDVICTLLSNTYLSDLTSRELYICKDLSNEKVVGVYSSLGSKLCDTYVLDVKGVIKDNTTDDAVYKEDAVFFNIDNVQEGLNVLTRRFPISVAGTVKYVTVIVEWEYVIPDSETLANTTDSLLDGTNQLTMNEVNEAIYTRPVDKTLQEWWDSNISISNSLANFMYGTQNVVYVKSGYLVPNLTILRDSVVTDASISTLFTSNGFKLDSIGLTYCNSTTKWWETYYSASLMQDPYTKSLAIANRGYKIYNAVEMTDGMLYDNEYYVTNAGVIYENVRANEQVTYSNNTLNIVTREVTNNKKLSPNTEFMYEGNAWIYLGTEQGTSNLYFVIQPNFVVNDFNGNSFRNTKRFGILPKFTSLDGQSSDSNLYDTAQTKLKEFYAKYFPDIEPWVNYGKSDKMFTANAFCIEQYFDKLYDKDAYYVAGDKLINGSNKTVTLKEGLDYTMFENNSIYCIPKLYIPADSFHFVEHEESILMLHSTPATALAMNGVMTSNIASSVIDSIIYKYTKTVSVNTLLNGQRILIGDIMFTKTTNEQGKSILLSDPIQSQSLVNALKTAEKEDEYAIIKGALFNGIMVDYNGYSYYLSNYIKSASIGNISNPSDNLGILYRRNGVKYVYNTSTDYNNLTETSNPRAVCIAIQLDDGLLAMPTNEKQNTYVLLMVSNTAADKTIDDIPFFTENLSYGDKTLEHVTVQTSKFKPSMLYTQARDNFKVMMVKAFAGDLITIIWMLIFYFAVYMAIMPYVMYAILTKGYGRTLFVAFTLPAHKSKFARNGIDIIKVFSFGIYNIDSEPTLARTFLSSFVCFFISYAIIFWQPF